MLNVSRRSNRDPGPRAGRREGLEREPGLVPASICNWASQTELAILEMRKVDMQKTKPDPSHFRFPREREKEDELGMGRLFALP